MIETKREALITKLKLDFCFFCVVMFLSIFMVGTLNAGAQVDVGIDVLLKESKFKNKIIGKKIGIITNHTAINRNFKSTIELIKADKGIKIVALFAPEHGLNGESHAEKEVRDSFADDGLPIYSLHGVTRRPTDEMLKGIDLLLFDMQDIGSRSYTYISTLFFVMEEAAKKKIPVIVADRPNPIGGHIVDGLLLDPKLKSFVGYVNVPYCHGMTIGELAEYFNKEYQVGCDLLVVPMKGWKRSMRFADTGLPWIPTSPQIPEMDTPFYYPATGLLGELQIVNTGIGYTLPFKVVGAPWIDAKEFANKLNSVKMPGVYFQPFYYCPFFGSFKNKECEGIKIMITDYRQYAPVCVQYLLIGMLKSMYPKQFDKALKKMEKRQEMFNKVNGSEEVLELIFKEKYPFYALKKLCQRDREKFIPMREKYLFSQYAD